MSGEVEDFDLAMLRELAQACSRPEFVAAFARDSLRDAGVAVERIAAAGAGQRWEEVRDRAHAVKGIAANVGALRVMECADALMRSPDPRMASSWRGELRRLRAALGAARDHLETLLLAREDWAPHR